MKKLRLIKLGAVVLGVAACSSYTSQAALATFDIQYSTDSRYIAYVYGNGGYHSTYLTAFTATKTAGDVPLNTPATFTTFCVDIAPTLASGKTWTSSEFPVTPGAGRLENSLSTAAQLYNAYVGKADISTESGKFYGAALQLALWEVLYDPTPYDVTSGDNFKVITAPSITFDTDPTSGVLNRSVMQEANWMLSTIGSLPPAPSMTFWNATTPENNQDLIGPPPSFSVPVPEPTTVFAGVLMLLPMLVSGIRIWKKQ